MLFPKTPSYISDLLLIVFYPEVEKFNKELNDIIYQNCVLHGTGNYAMRFRRKAYPGAYSLKECLPLHLNLHVRMSDLLEQQKQFQLSQMLLISNFLVSAFQLTHDTDQIVSLFPSGMAAEVESSLADNLFRLDEKVATREAFDAFTEKNQKYITMLKVRQMDRLLMS